MRVSRRFSMVAFIWIESRYRVWMGCWNLSYQFNFQPISQLSVNFANRKSPVTVKILTNSQLSLKTHLDPGLLANKTDRSIMYGLVLLDHKINGNPTTNSKNVEFFDEHSYQYERDTIKYKWWLTSKDISVSTLIADD